MYCEYNNGYLNLDVIYIINRNSKFECGFIDSEYGVSEFSVNVIYVHQLQNLYFAITGNELILKQQ